MRSGWGDRELDLPAHPITPYAAARRARLVDDLPRRAAGDPGRRLQGPQPTTPTTASAPTPRTPTSAATRPRRGPRHRRTARRRCTPGRARAARPTSSSATASTASCGPAAVRRCTRSPTPSGSTCEHIDDLPAALSGTGKTRVLRGVDSARGHARSPATSAATRSSPACCPRCGWSRTSGRSASSQAACDATALGFEDSVRDWANVLKYGERWIEGTFFRRARARATTSATTRSSAPARTPPRCTGSRTTVRSPRASCCCSTWAWRATTSTPPT